MLKKDLQKRKFTWNEVQSISMSIALEMLLMAYNLYIDKEVPFDVVVKNSASEVLESEVNN